MKKLIFCIIALCLTFSVGSFCVSAESNEHILEKNFFDFCNSKVASDSEYDNVRIDDYIESDGKIFFMGNCSWIFMHEMVLYVDYMGDWTFLTSPSTDGISGLGVYVMENNEIITIEKAWKDGVVTDLTPVSELEGLYFYHIGDVNGDKNLNIKDVSSLQKFLAMYETDVVKNLTIRDCVFDMNRDNSVDIRDATAIQKSLAKIEA